MAESQTCGTETKYNLFQAEVPSGKTIVDFAECYRDGLKANGSLNGKKFDYVVSDTSLSKWSLSTKADTLQCLLGGYNVDADNGEVCKTIDAAQKQISSGKRLSTAVAARIIIVIVVWLPWVIIVVIIVL
ncbi:hypothetical protein HA402_009023 [Bradysia odoriphaga]|nr:hypothetical protein HA402_009023 [Bradysia odoriphaga]